MKKLLYTTAFVFFGLNAKSQQTNFSNLNVGFAYGFPRGGETKDFNHHLFNAYLQQDIALNKFLSASVLSDYIKTKGKSNNPDIESLGLGAGIKIQFFPLFEAVFKKSAMKFSNSYNLYIGSSATVNVNEVKGYAKAGNLVNINSGIGLEFIKAEKYIYTVFYKTKLLMPKDEYPLAHTDTYKTFTEIGVSLGLKNFSKKDKVKNPENN